MKDLATKNTKDTKKVWPKVRLGDVCEEIRERISSSKVSVECYVTTDNMVKGCGGVRVADNVPESVGLVCYQKGDVLLSNIRPYLKKSWLADRDGGCSNDVIVFRSLRSDLSPEYLFRVLSQDGFFDYSMQNVSGTKMPRGKRDWIKSFQFPLPPLSVQREIVARLEKELGEADKLAAKFKRVAELADDAFKAELDETFKALEGERVRLGQVEDTGRIILGRGKIISKIDINACPGDYPVYSSSAMGDGEIGRYGKYMFDDKRITWSIDGGGRLFYRDVARYSVTNVCGWLKVVDPQIDTKYLYYGLTSAWLEIDFNYVHKAHPSVIRNEYYVALPPASIQRAIVAKLDAAKERCEKLKAAAMRGHAAAENLRKAILAEAFEQ